MNAIERAESARFEALLETRYIVESLLSDIDDLSEDMKRVRRFCDDCGASLARLARRTGAQGIHVPAVPSGDEMEDAAGALREAVRPVIEEVDATYEEMARLLEREDELAFERDVRRLV